MKCALDLINRQQAEIEKLTADNEQYEKINLLLANQRNYRDKEIECLENAVEMLNCELDMAKDCIPEQRAEAGKKVFEATINKILSIKGHYVNIDGEFVEVESSELLDELENLFGIELCEYNEDYEDNINNLVKEMVGE